MWRASAGRLRDELLAVEAFTSLLEAMVLVEDWRIEYNTLRPHSALGYLTRPTTPRPGPPPTPNSHSRWTNNRGPVRIVGPIRYMASSDGYLERLQFVVWPVLDCRLTLWSRNWVYTAVDANHADRSTTPIIDKSSEVCNVITVTYDTEWAYRGPASPRVGSHCDRRMSLARGKHDGTSCQSYFGVTRLRPKKGGHGA
jgi:hypothetical protein